MGEWILSPIPAWLINQLQLTPIPALSNEPTVIKPIPGFEAVARSLSTLSRCTVG